MLAKRWSILILTRPSVKTDFNRSLLVDWWSIEVVDWVNQIIGIQMYSYMPLSFIHNCQCCSVATASLGCFLIYKIRLLCICVNIVIETYNSYPLPSTKMV